MKRRLNLSEPVSAQPVAEAGQGTPATNLDPLVADLILPEFLTTPGAGGEVPGIHTDDASFAQAVTTQALRCAERTADLIIESGIESEAVVRERLQGYHANFSTTPPGDCVLDFLAFSVWNDYPDARSEEEAVRKARDLSMMLSARFTMPVSHLASTGRQEGVGDPYEASERFREICRRLMCPVIQSRGTDFFSIASINPVTAYCAGPIAAKQIEAATGHRPFYFVLTTGLGAWSRFCRDHFNWQSSPTGAAT